MTTTTPDMNLILPDVSITAGPQWATLLNTAFNLIDSHDHSSGKGAIITPAGLNISSDLTFAQNNATNLRTVRLFNNSAITPGVSDKTCLYALNNELYFIDGAGNNIQMTLNGVIDLSGTISALTIKDSGFTLEYFGDVTRQMKFNLSAIPTSTIRTMSVPDSGANDTFVTQAATQTLTNKTLTTPAIAAINTGSVTFTLPATDGTSGQVVQTNGSAVLSFVDPAGAPAANIAANDSNVTFTSSSNKYQICNPTAARTYTMPSSLTAGVPWTFYNRATTDGLAITLQTSGSNTITTVPPKGTVIITPLTSTPTTAANWLLTGKNSDWVSYTPTLTGVGTATGNTSYYRFENRNLKIRGSFACGTVTAALFSLTLPSQFSLDSTVLSQNNNTGNAGNIIGQIGNGNNGGQGGDWIIPAPSTSTTLVYVGTYFADVGSHSTLIPQNGNVIFGTGSAVSYQFEVAAV